MHCKIMAQVTMCTEDNQIVTSSLKRLPSNAISIDNNNNNNYVINNNLSQHPEFGHRRVKRAVGNDKQRKERSHTNHGSSLIEGQCLLTELSRRDCRYARKSTLGHMPAARWTYALLAILILFNAHQVILGQHSHNDSSFNNKTSQLDVKPAQDQLYDSKPTTTSNTSSSTTSAATTIASLETTTSTQSPSNDHNNNNDAKLLKNVNFTQVDEIFNAVLSDSELVNKWRLMDVQIQDGIKAILKMIFPQIIAMSQDAKVSGECSGAILKWILSLRNLRSWAIKMLDASGKPTSGIFQGSLSMLGNYDQCLAIRAPDEDEIEITEQFEEYFRGRYCVLHMRPWLPSMPAFYNLNATIEPLLRKSYKYYEKTLYDELAEIASAFNFVHLRMDLCIPSSCNEHDIQRVADLLGRKVEMRAKVMRCDTESRDSWWTRVDSVSSTWLFATILIILVPILASLTSQILSTLLKYNYLRDTSCSSLRDCLTCLSLGPILKDRLTSRCIKQKSTITSYPGGDIFTNQQLNGIINAKMNGDGDQQDNEVASGVAGGSESSLEVSAPNNRKLSTRVSDDNDRMRAINFNTSSGKSYQLHLVRIVLIIWIIIVQLSADLNYQYIRESLVLRSMLLNYWPFQMIINTTLMFESLILLTAFSFAYTCLGWSAYRILTYFVQKYWRLMMPMVAVISLTILLPLANVSTPIWRNMVEQQSTLCKTNGLFDLLLLQNFIPYDKMCLPHTWVLCVEYQLALLSIPLLLLIGKTMSEKLIVPTASKTNQDYETYSAQPVYRYLFKSIGGLICLQLIVFGSLMNFLIVYTNNLPPAWFSTFPEPRDKNFYYSHYLTKPWAHLSTFVIGLLAGSLAKCLIKHRQSILSYQSGINQQDSMVPIDGGNRFMIGDQQLQPSPTPSFSSSSPSGFHHTSRSQSNSTINQTSNTGSTIVLTSTITNSDSINGANTNQNYSHSSKSSRSIDISDLSVRANGKLTDWVHKLIFTLVPLVIMLTIIYSTFGWSTRELPGNLVAALYDSGSRILWSVCLSTILIKWIINLPEHNDVRLQNNNSTSTWQSICIILGRLSLIAYLVSPLINNLLLAVQEQAIFSSIFIMFHLIIGNTVLIYVLSFLLAILIEQPVTRFVRYVTTGESSSKP